MSVKPEFVWKTHLIRWAIPRQVKSAAFLASFWVDLQIKLRVFYVELWHLWFWIEIVARHWIICDFHDPHVNGHFKTTFCHVKIKNGMRTFKCYILRLISARIDAKALYVCFWDFIGDNIKTFLFTLSTVFWSEQSGYLIDDLSEWDIAVPINVISLSV